MRIGEVVQFQQQRFFNGAVQLGWVQAKPDLAAEVARSFVFHGPRYHGADDEDGLERAYRLKDTASFVCDLLQAMTDAAEGREINPYWLAVAGYGSGKSHLSVTIAELFAAPRGETARQVLAQVRAADAEIGAQLGTLLAALPKPVLVLPVDGSGRFHLGNALSQVVFAQLDNAGVDADAIRALSPRFSTAEQFVERNLAFRRDAFAAALPGQDDTAIVAALRSQDETVFDAVNGVYTEANGHPIPIEGQESAQALIATLCDIYCADDGPFSHVLVLFDELGMYLTHAAEHATRSGASVLQELFQGIQDHSGKAQFVGFIQYELKAYLKRFGSADLKHLQRYVTRFDGAEKWYLSTNLETLFAHLLRKDEAKVETLWQQAAPEQQARTTWQRLALALPGFQRYPTWCDQDQFARVIHRGCWPLHPLAVWFLTRQQDLVQQRSALAFVKEVTEQLRAEPAQDGAGLRQVGAARLVLDYMLSELVAAERETGGGVAETLQGLLDQHAASLTHPQRLLLAGVAVLEKARVGAQEREVMDALLCEATTLDAATITEIIATLADTLGAIEWNADLRRYELISDGASRGQFEHWLRAQRQAIGADDTRALFVRRGATDCPLGEVRPNFGPEHDIRTPDWTFEARQAHLGMVEHLIRQVCDEWQAASLPSEAKGKLIYLFLHADDDALEAEARVATCLAAQLQRMGLAQAPIWVACIEDRAGRIAEHLARLAILDEKIAGSDGERFRRFIPDEQERSRSALKTLVEDALRERRFLVAGFPEPPAGRLKATASAVFAAVYPQAPPFPFDGFTTANGGGAKDAVQVAKALLAGNVNLPWIQSQPKRLRNRIDTVLLNSWQALNMHSGSPCRPGNLAIRSLCELLQQAHQDDSARKLLTSYRQVIAPPYGMNTASAALLFGLLLAFRDPQRAVEADGEQLTPAQWMTRAFATRPGRHQLDEGALAAARLRFFDADAETRWRELLERWEAAERLDLKVKLAKQAKQQKDQGPVPPSLAADYVRLVADAEHAAARLLEVRHRIDRWLDEIQRAHTAQSVHHALRFGAAALQEHKDMSATGVWPKDLLADCERVATFAREIVVSGIDHYTPTQNCASPQQIGAFRERMESEERWLAELGFTAQARRHETHKRRVITTVEERARWNETLASCTDYPRQPSPKASTPVLELTDEIKRGDDLLQTLQEIPASVLSSAETEAYTQGIRNRQQALKQAVKEREEALGQLDLLQIDSEERMQEAAVRVEQVRKLFAGRRDEEQINDLANLLQRLKSDMHAWEMGEVGVERLAELLAQQTGHQLAELRRWLDTQEIEPPPQWDLDAIYKALVDERVEIARRRSADWLRPRMVPSEQIVAFDKARCTTFERELAGAPAYLSNADRATVEKQLAVVRQRLSELAEAQRLASMSTWRQRYDAVADIAALDRAQTESLLRALEQPPCGLLPEEATWQRAALDRLTAHLDQLSLDDLCARIERLSGPLRATLFERLTRLMATAPG